MGTAAEVARDAMATDPRLRDHLRLVERKGAPEGEWKLLFLACRRCADAAMPRQFSGVGTGRGREKLQVQGTSGGLPGR